MNRSIVPQFALFLVFGIAAAGVHFLCLAVLTSAGASALVASQVGFVGGGLFSYAANKLVTFRSHGSHRTSGPRYVVAMGIGWVVNGATFATLNGLGAGLYPSQVGATALVAVGSFLLQKYWAFQT